MLCAIVHVPPFFFWISFVEKSSSVCFSVCALPFSFNFFSCVLCSIFVQQYLPLFYRFKHPTDRHKHDEQRRQRILWFRTVSTTSNNMSWSPACAHRRVSKIYDNFIILLRFWMSLFHECCFWCCRIDVFERTNPFECCRKTQNREEKSKLWSAQQCQSALRLNRDTAPSRRLVSLDIRWVKRHFEEPTTMENLSSWNFQISTLSLSLSLSQSTSNSLINGQQSKQQQLRVYKIMVMI